MKILIIAISLIASTAFAKPKITAPSETAAVEEQLKFKVGDENGNEIKALKTELLVMRSEKKALDQLKKLHHRYANTPMEPEILLRLGELFMRRARTERFFEVHKDSQQMMVLTPQLVKEASEKGEIRKAISYYESVQKKYPNYRSMDVVIFNSAYAHQQIGEDKAAEALLGKLIRSFPDSSLVPDSYLTIGEINYQRRNFSAALENFNAIKRYPEARVYPYGLYKAAWSYYNLQDAEAGIRKLEEVIKFGRMVTAQSLDSKLDLRKEALGDLALFYGDARPADRAVDYFVAQAQEIDAVPYLMRLTELFERHGRLNEVELVLTGILRKLPKSEAIPTVHERLAWFYDRMKNHGLAIAQLEAFAQHCDAAEKNPSSANNECRAKIADASRKMGLKWHALWKKSGGIDGGQSNVKLSASSEKAYRLYLRMADAKDADRPTTHFALAEMLFARGQYRDASENYATIDSYLKPGVKVDAKIVQEAAYGAVLSLERAVGNKWSDEDEKRFIALSETYIKRAPQGTYALELRFKRAFIAYEKERYDEAAPQFKKLGWMELPPAGVSREKVLKAQDLYLDILNVKKDYRTLREAAQSLLGRKPDAARVTQVAKIYREAYFAEIQGLEEKGELHDAIAAYKKFAGENSESELAPKAWWNASQLQFRIGDAMGGATTCQQLYALYPKTANGKDCITKSAQAFESMGRLDLAAKAVMSLAEIEPAKADHWREVAADFQALSGNAEAAIATYLKMAETQKSPVALLEKAAQLARESGDTKTMKSIEARYAKSGIEPHASRQVVEQAEEALVRGDFTNAFNISKRIIAKDELPKELLARARFVQARVLEDEYRRQSVKTRVDRVGVVLAIKTEKLEKAQKAYQSAIRYGHSGVSVKALRRLAESYLDYAKSVRGLTLTSQLSPNEEKAFQAEIEQLATPMEEKGIEAMEQALAAAQKAQLRDGQVAEIQEEINRLNMRPSTAPTIVVANPVVYMPEFRATKEMGL